jgi:hypothetical protein
MVSVIFIPTQSLKFFNFPFVNSIIGGWGWIITNPINKFSIIYAIFASKNAKQITLPGILF